MEHMDLSKMNKKDLLEKCKELGITTSSSKNKQHKQQLIDLIIESMQNLSVSDNIINNTISQHSQHPQHSQHSQHPQHSPYTFIEVCAGGGGLSSGLIKSGFTPILLNDNNSDCCKTLKHNHPEAEVICASMDKVDYSQFINKVDLLTGGVPCQ